MKSKHYRKDVILARIIFGIFCIAVIALLTMGGMKLKEKLDATDNDKNSQNSQSQNSQMQSENESPSQSESESVSESESQSESESESESEPVIVYYAKTTVRLKLREEANTSSDVLTVVPEGEKALIIEELEDWYKVSYEGREGYLFAEYVNVIEETQPSPDTEQTTVD